MSLNIDKIVAAIPSAGPEKRRQMRTNARTWLETGTDAQKQAAQTLLTALDGQEAQEREALIGELRGMAVSERVVRAFTVQKMTETEARLIQALLDNPGSTSSALSRAMGWEAQSWHLHFGTMCFNRSTYLWPAPESERRDGAFYSGILADFDDASSTFTMKAEVAAAFAKLGLRPKHAAR